MLQPGEESTITLPAHTMEDPHLFEVTVESNDPTEPEKKVYLSFEVVPDDVASEDGGQPGEESSIVVPE